MGGTGWNCRCEGRAFHSEKLAEYCKGERMNLRRVVLFVFTAVLVLAAVRAGSARPAGDEASGFAAADAQILSEIPDHNQVMEKLEELFDEIAPRLNGSPQLKQADRAAS